MTFKRQLEIYDFALSTSLYKLLKSKTEKKVYEKSEY